MMQGVEYAKAWLVTKVRRDEQGQGVTEYVLLIGGVVLFLIAAAFLLKGALSTTASNISTWITGAINTNPL